MDIYEEQAAQELRLINTALKTAGLMGGIEEDVTKDVWVSRGLEPATQVIARFKDGKTPPVRFKASDAIDAAVQALRNAPDEGARRAALQQLDMLTRPAGGAISARLSDDEKPPVAATKAALSPIEQIARRTAPELYSTKGSKR